MDARRYDRNADQLAQIFWHLGRLNTKNNEEAAELALNLRHHIEQALIFNDYLGKMAEKGLI